MVGKTLSHYRILDELGRGGMGIVYKAVDTKLDRTVAIKVLPSAALASDDDRARFYREAKAAAALHHPHIASVFEIDEAAVSDVPPGTPPSPFIAMEFIEGETLAERIEKGPLKLDEAVRIASQIAGGLEAAHEKNIVHRDVKSANVMLTTKGEAKILDFGLAQTAHSTKLTQLGSTLGTVAYMSPEQARGEEVDLRTDLWALGAVLYEMISGRHPFPGNYEQAVVYSILNEDPEPLTAVRTGVPMSLEWIVTKLLTKERENRYQSATDLLVDLRMIDVKAAGMSRLSTTSGVAAPAMTSRSRGTAVGPDVPASASRRFTPAAMGLTALLTAVLTAVLVWFVKPAPEVETPTRRFRIQLPGVRVQNLPALSPDGSRMAFFGSDTAGVQVGIFVYEAQSGAVRYVPDSDLLWRSVFSPEGRWIVMDGPAGLSKVPAAGGTPARLAVQARSFAWLSEDELVVAEDSSLYRLSIEGGQREQIAVANAEKGHRAFRELCALPGGSHVLATAIRDDEPLVDLVVFDLKTGAYQVLIQQAGSGLYVRSGHLVYLQDTGTGSFQSMGQLMARPFDVRTQAFTGSAVPLSGGVLTSSSFHLSLDGTFVSMRAGVDSDDKDVFWIDSTGMRIGDLLELREVDGDATLSPNGRLLAHERENPDEGQQDIWVYDLVSRTENRFSFAGHSSDPAWSPDGRYVIYPGNREDGPVLLRKPVDGSSTEEVLPVPGDNPQHPALSQDGRRLAYEAQADGGPDIVVVSTDDLSDVWRAERPGRQRYPSLSPDGRFVVFQTQENDRWEVYVQVVGGDAFWAVSAAGERAVDPVWSWDGRYIYYTVGGVGLRRVRVETAPSFRRYTPETIFRMRGNMMHAHHADGGRILLLTDVETDRGYLDLVLGFDEELKRLAPPDG